MQPLLKISSVPITIEYTTKRATLQQSADAPAPRPAYRPHGLSVRAQAPRIQVAPAAVQAHPQPLQRRTPQTPEAQRSAPALPGNAQDEAMDDVPGVVMPSSGFDILRSPPVPDPEPVQQYTEPVAQSQVAATPVSYQMDRPTFDWNVNSRPQLEFVPASLEFSVAQYNDVVIEYVGDPIYVPPSANPNYVPLPGETEA